MLICAVSDCSKCYKGRQKIVVLEEHNDVACDGEFGCMSVRLAFGGLNPSMALSASANPSHRNLAAAMKTAPAEFESSIMRHLQLIKGIFAFFRYL